MTEIEEDKTATDSAQSEPDQSVDEQEVSEQEEAPKDEGSSGEAAKEKKPQSKEDNAYYANLRREAKAKEEAKKSSQGKRTYEEGVLQGKLDSIKTNPYTETPIRNKHDLDLYEMMKRLDDDGKDPLKFGYSEISRLLSEQDEREAEEKSKAEEKAKAESERQAQVRKETEEAIKAYPDLDLKALISDKGFGKWLDSHQGMSLSESIDYYSYKHKDEFEKFSKTPSVKAKGSLSSIGSAKGEKLATEMSDEEYLAYLASQGKAL